LLTMRNTNGASRISRVTWYPFHYYVIQPLQEMCTPIVDSYLLNIH